MQLGAPWTWGRSAGRGGSNHWEGAVREGRCRGEGSSLRIEGSLTSHDLQAQNMGSGPDSLALRIVWLGELHFRKVKVKDAQLWKVVAEWLDAGFLASGGDEFNPGPETRLDCLELLCNKVLLKYKGDRESFWHRHQKGAKEYPPPSL